MGILWVWAGDVFVPFMIFVHVAAAFVVVRRAQRRRVVGTGL